MWCLNRRGIKVNLISVFKFTTNSRRTHDALSFFHSLRKSRNSGARTLSRNVTLSCGIDLEVYSNWQRVKQAWSWNLFRPVHLQYKLMYTLYFNKSTAYIRLDIIVFLSTSSSILLLAYLVVCYIHDMQSKIP